MMCVDFVAKNRVFFFKFKLFVKLSLQDDKLLNKLKK